MNLQPHLFLTSIPAKILGRERSEISARFVRASLSELLKIDATHLPLTKSNLGKPEIENAEGWQFSVSHSGDQLGVAFLKNYRVGFDLQQQRHIDFKITEKVFSQTERQLFLSVPEIDRNKFFFNLWVRKEATLKAIGTGFQYPMSQLEFHGDKTVWLEPTHPLLNGALPEIHCTAINLNIAQFSAALAMETDFSSELVIHER